MAFKIFNKFRKKYGLYNHRKECIKWVKANLGEEHVEEFLDKYDRLTQGDTIGGYLETVVFVDMIHRIEKEMLT